MGRAREMVRLRALLGEAERVAIAAVGMGGIGKTTLARRYVRQYRNDYPGGIWWVAVDEMVPQVLDYAARSVGLDELPAEWDGARIVQHYWARWEALLPQRKLLVLDDAGEYAAVEAFLPVQGAFQVLMTTRVQMQRPVRCLPLEVLRPSAAFRLLRELVEDDGRLRADVGAARSLGEWLGYLPLGIEVVAKLLVVEPDWSLAKLLGELKQEKMRHEAMSAVEAAFELSWQRLTVAEQQLAVMLSLFALAPIPWELVEQAIAQCGVGKESAETEEWCLLLEAKALGLARRKLVELSLINRVGEGTYQLHGLVRAFFQAKGEMASWAVGLQRGFAQGLIEVAKRVSQTVTVAERKRIVEVVPHLEVVAAQWTERLEGTDKIWCCVGLARFYQSSNLWNEAQRCYQRSLEICKAELGDRHPDTAISLNNLAELYRLQGHYGEAEPLCVEALEIRKAELGDHHPDTVISLNNLALLYHSLARYEEAEPLYVEALEISRAELGEHHLDTAMSLNNLAGLYRLQGRYGEAEPLCVEALEIRKAKLGDHHPDTAISLNNIAVLYDLQGRYGEAELLYVKALEIRKAELGDRHLDTAGSLLNLATLYYQTQRVEQALSYIQQAVAIFVETLGAEHPNTNTAYSWLQTIQEAAEKGT